MLDNASPNLTLTKEVQPEKVEDSMDVKLSGSDTCDKEVQPEKAEDSSDVKLSGSDTCDKEVQFWNALLDIVVIVLGMDTDCNVSLFVKADSPIDITLNSRLLYSTVWGIVTAVTSSSDNPDTSTVSSSSEITVY